MVYLGEYVACSKVSILHETCSLNWHTFLPFCFLYSILWYRCCCFSCEWGYCWFQDGVYC